MGDKKPPEFVIDNQSPYYLHPSDAPGAIITAIKFDGKNYELWEKVVTMALTAKNKIALIDGTIQKLEIKKGEYSLEANAWIIVNSMITSWILNVIDQKLHASIAHAIQSSYLGEH